MYGTVLVDARRVAHQLEALAMKCDAKEIPRPLDEAKPVGWWLAGDCTFGGSALRKGQAGALGAPQQGTLKGQAAMAVCANRIIGILSPASAAGPAIWWSWPLGDLDVGASGSQGIFKKRPQALKLDRDGGIDGASGDTIILKSVVKLLPSSKKFQSGQEGTLLAALHR